MSQLCFTAVDFKFLKRGFSQCYLTTSTLDFQQIYYFRIDGQVQDSKGYWKHGKKM